MLNLKQVLESVESNFNSKNRERLTGNIIKYHLSLLLFFVASTGVILVGSITAPGQISPVQAWQDDYLTTGQLLEGEGSRVRIPHQGMIDLKCQQSTNSPSGLYGNAPRPYSLRDVGAGARVKSTKNGKWQPWTTIPYRGSIEIWAEGNGRYAIQPIYADGTTGSLIVGEFQY